MKTYIREYLKKNRLFFDGAFGTYYTRLVGTDTKFRLQVTLTMVGY